MTIHGLSKTESEIIRNKNKCSINKVLNLARKSKHHKASLLDYFANEYKKHKKETIGYNQAYEYLYNLLLEDSNFKNKTIARITPTPEITFEKEKLTSNALLNFYRALGWNKVDYLNPKKIRVSHETYKELLSKLRDETSNAKETEMFFVNYAPGVDECVPNEIVVMLDGWVLRDEA